MSKTDITEWQCDLCQRKERIEGGKRPEGWHEISGEDRFPDRLFF